MKNTGMHRLQRALAAMKQAEMARLGEQVRLAATSRAEAADLREKSRSLAVRDHSASGLLHLSQWQNALEFRARAAEAAAAAADTAAVPIRAALSRTLGREAVTTSLIATAEAEARHCQERRSEDALAVRAVKSPKQ